MGYIEDFIKKAIEQDKRNYFSEEKNKVKGIPKEFESLYEKHNPIDVEVTLNGNSVKFIPYEELESVKTEYTLPNDCFIFATCNGDPVYYKKGTIYSCVFGKKGIIENVEALSLEKYLSFIDCL